MSRQELLELEMRHRRARRVGVERVAEPVVPVPPDRRVDRAPPRLRLSDDEREVLARQPAPPEEPLQALEGRLRPRHDEQPRRVTVEPMDDSLPVLLPALCP